MQVVFLRHSTLLLTPTGAGLSKKYEAVMKEGAMESLILSMSVAGRSHRLKQNACVSPLKLGIY